MPRSPQLDGVRGLAISGVLAFHLVGVWGLAEPGTLGSFALWLCGAGYLGVDLFFVLSGFLLGGILLENREADNYYRVFYLRRAARILPLYAVCLAVFYLARAAVPPGTLAHNLLLADPLPWWAYATLTQNCFLPLGETTFRAGMLLPTWSLAVEEQFYLIVPLLLRWVAPRALPGTLAVLVAAAPLLRSWLYTPGPQGGLYYTLLPCRWDALFLGVLAAWMWRQGRVARPAAAGTLVSFGLLLAALHWHWPTNYGAGMATAGYTVAAVAFAALMLLANAETPALAWLAWAPLRWLGRISYGLYLCHYGVHVAAHAWLLGAVPSLANWQEAGVTLCGLAVSIALASASWVWLEEPILRRARGEAYHVPRSAQRARRRAESSARS